MQTIMVKKRLASGQPCKKCVQAEELLQRRGLYATIDEVVWADESDSSSAGMVLAREFGVDLAPFFIAQEPNGERTVYTSVVQFAKMLSQRLGADAPSASVEYSAKDASAVGQSVLAAASELSEAPPARILKWGLERYGQRCAIAFSGAEDVVLIDVASRLGLPFTVFCLDTGRLHPQTYRFIDKVRGHYGIEIALFSPSNSELEPFIRTKGLFSFYEDGHRECCQIRKIAPLRRALNGMQAWVTGQRKDQSVTRVDLELIHVDNAYGSPQSPLVKLNPLANWSGAQVWSYIRNNQVPYNALHDQGFVSIGCEPCTRPLRPGEHERAARWWWEESTQRECGLHVSKG